MILKNILPKNVFFCRFPNLCSICFQCKHVLAMKLSEAMEKCTEKVITDGELADVVKGIWD